MNRSELVEAISKRTEVPASQVDAVLRGFNDVVAQVVAKGEEKLTIPGFLSFEQSHRSARTARNPQTGAPIEVPATNTVKVSAGSRLKAVAAGKEAPPS